MRLIDADTLKAEFTGNFNELWHYIAIKALIDCAPTIDPKDLRSKGKWISKGRKLECSICHHRVYLGTDDEGLHKTEKGINKYCFNCGAEMDGKE